MCSKSETITKIASALVKFSGEVKSISHDANNPHFKSEYTSLDHMIDETKPILHKHGLTIMQFPGGDGEKVTMRTMILHESGEWIETEPFTVRPVKTDPQGMGSATTYARRYTYAAALSLSLGDDDDGNEASRPTTPVQTRQPYAPNQPSAQPQNATASRPSASQGNQLISDAQIGYAKKLQREKRISDEDFHRMVSEYNDGNDDIKQLPKRAASEFINFLNSYNVA